MGIILLLVLLLGSTALNNAHILWGSTQELYNHPLLVQRTLGIIRADVLSIRLEMKELMLEKDERKIPLRVGAVNTLEADIQRMVEVLYSAYLGPKSDIDKADRAILEWKPIRDETIRLLQEGKLDEAVQSVTFDGTGGIQAQKVLSALDAIDGFAQGKAASFYKAAEQKNSINNIQMGFVFGIILLMALGVAYVLRKMILTPLGEMTLAANAFQQGNLAARSRYESANDFGRLSRAYNMMLETVQADMQNRENVTVVSAAMMVQEDLNVFCREMLKALISRTGSQTGGVYLLNGSKSEYELFESVGLHAGAKAKFSATGLEGEFGMALATKQIQHVTDIPHDTRFSFSTVNGEFIPKEIWTIPVLNETEVIAMVSLAGIRKYPVSAIRLVEDAWGILNARMNGALSYRQIKEFSNKLQNTNRELDEQAQELAMQSDELMEQNIELEMQKKMLDESDKLKSSFLSNMSHELRTPLNSVIALASVLNRRLLGIIPDDEHGYLEVIERNGKLLLTLVNDILDISRIEAGREELAVTLFSMRELVDDVVEMIGPQASEKGISLKNRISASLPAICSDASMCRHILQNLIGNAVKFTDAGSVEISAILTREHMQVSVTDTGIGITPDQIEFIFDEFRQADDSTSKKYGGTGLGLAIAKKYAGLLHGSIAVMSRPGTGSTFMLRLPLTAVDGTLLKETMKGALYAGQAD
jgi:signal transduction histidine kinase